MVKATKKSALGAAADTFGILSAALPGDWPKYATDEDGRREFDARRSTLDARRSAPDARRIHEYCRLVATV